MQFSVLSKGAVLAALFTAAQCAPKVTVGKVGKAGELSERAIAINDCGDSTFINRSSGGSPRVADCEQLARNIAGDGTWTVDDSAQHQLAQYGTCAFGVTVHSDGAWYAYIGNEDIRDLIFDSIKRFRTFKVLDTCLSVPHRDDES